MPIERKAWQCEYCSKKAHTKRTIVLHEKRCWWNPAYRGCTLCDHCQEATDTIKDDFGCSITTMIKVCTRHNFTIDESTHRLNCPEFEMSEPLYEGNRMHDAWEIRQPKGGDAK